MKKIITTTAMLVALTTATYASDYDDDDRGPRGYKGEVGAQGPKGDTGPAGKDGARGLQGVPGKDGARGLQGVVDYNKVQNYDATVASLAGLELLTPDLESWSWAGGIGGTQDATAIAAGLAYGISENSMVYGKVSHSIDDSYTAYFIGLSGKF